MNCPKKPMIRLLVKLLKKCHGCERFQGTAILEGGQVLIHCGAGPGMSLPRRRV
jgi:hypothetical protein